MTEAKKFALDMINCNPSNAHTVIDTILRYMETELKYADKSKQQENMANQKFWREVIEEVEKLLGKDRI